MNLYEQIFEQAARKFNSIEELESDMPVVLTKEQIESRSDAFYLSTMSRRIFQAGMRHSVINSKWDHFEEVFWGFNPNKLIYIDEAFMERAMQDKGLIRHWGKLQTIPVNALEMIDLSKENESFGHFIAGWDRDVTALWTLLAKRFKRMGGRSSCYFLRMVGLDTFILTDDVVRRLITLNIIDKKPTSKKDLLMVNNAFNELREVSGRPLSHISKLLALSLE